MVSYVFLAPMILGPVGIFFFLVQYSSKNQCFFQGADFFPSPFFSFGKRSAGSFRRGCECIVLEPSEMIVVDYMDENEEYFQRQASHRQSRRRFRKINQKGERQTIIDTVDAYPVGKPPLPRGYHT
ncbi:hypothetical protein lerEdw1_012214, partial [Lerista edwardsae]